MIVRSVLPMLLPVCSVVNSAARQTLSSGQDLADYNTESQEGKQSSC